MAKDSIIGPQVLLGDEAIALGAVHAGISTAYAYPGTPSTEILEYLVGYAAKFKDIKAIWTTNEKTALEQALGASMVGRRSLVAMKHVGLNVAADPFMNAAVVDIHGGLVIAVADDPGMHSSQNEQDSRYFADFARVPCFEPTNQQEAYEMTREAFEVSERFGVPVLMRLVTRLAHSRAVVESREGLDQRPAKKPDDPNGWILLPANARRQWRKLLEQQAKIESVMDTSSFNTLVLDNPELGVITCGIARNYYLENVESLGFTPSFLHIGAYPFPKEKIRKLASHVKRLLILEDGYPFVERYVRGVLPTPIPIEGKESGQLPMDGELNPELVRSALGIEPLAKGAEIGGFELPPRPPQLCTGCPHGDSFAAINNIVKSVTQSVVTSDIGCYTLGALPPYQTIESCVCMGASVSMAKGASDAGFQPAFAVIGDSTFLHSGVTPLMDAVANDAPMTLIIVDNFTVAMTGGQPTILPNANLVKVVEGCGVDPAHIKRMRAHPRDVEKIEAALRAEMEHAGLSVVILFRECLETLKVSKKSKKSPKPAANA